ncbi:MAG: hypothetical protein O3A01_05455 [bacterium]|nr:hypothetical protein [bacterium]
MDTIKQIHHALPPTWKPAQQGPTLLQRIRGANAVATLKSPRTTGEPCYRLTPMEATLNATVVPTASRWSLARFSNARTVDLVERQRQYGPVFDDEGKINVSDNRVEPGNWVLSQRQERPASPSAVRPASAGDERPSIINMGMGMGMGMGTLDGSLFAASADSPDGSPTTASHSRIHTLDDDGIRPAAAPAAAPTRAPMHRQRVATNYREPDVRGRQGGEVGDRAPGTIAGDLDKLCRQSGVILDEITAEAVGAKDTKALAESFSTIQRFNNRLQVLQLFLQIALLEITSDKTEYTESIPQIKALSGAINVQMQSQVDAQLMILKALQTKSNATPAATNAAEIREKNKAKEALLHCAKQDFQPHSRVQLLRYQFAAVWGRQALAIQKAAPGQAEAMRRAVYQLRFIVGNIFHHLEQRRNADSPDDVMTEKDYKEGLKQVGKGRIEIGDEAQLDAALEVTIGDGSKLKKKELYAYTSNPLNGEAPMHTVTLRPTMDGGYAVTYTKSEAIGIDWKEGFVCSGKRKAVPNTPANHHVQVTKDLYQDTEDTVFRLGSVTTEAAALKAIMAALRHTLKVGENPGDHGDPVLVVENLVSVGNPKDAKIARLHRESLAAAAETIKTWARSISRIVGENEAIYDALCPQNDPRRPIFDELRWKCGKANPPEGVEWEGKDAQPWQALHDTLKVVTTQTGVNMLAPLGRMRELGINNTQLMEVGRAAIKRLQELKTKIEEAEAGGVGVAVLPGARLTKLDVLRRDYIALSNALFLLNRTWQTNGFMNPKRTKSDLELPALINAVTILSGRKATSIFGCMSNKDRASIVNAEARAYVTSARDGALRKAKQRVDGAEDPAKTYVDKAHAWLMHQSSAYGGALFEESPGGGLLAPKTATTVAHRSRPFVIANTGLKSEFARAFTTTDTAPYDGADVTTQYPRAAGTNSPELLMVDQEDDISTRDAHRLFIAESNVATLKQNLDQHYEKFMRHFTFYDNVLETGYEQFTVQTKNVGIGGAKYKSFNWEVLSGVGRVWIMMYKAGQERLEALELPEQTTTDARLHRKVMPKIDRMKDRIARGESPSIRSFELIFFDIVQARKNFMLGGSERVAA